MKCCEYNPEADSKKIGVKLSILSGKLDHINVLVKIVYNYEIIQDTKRVSKFTQIFYSIGPPD
jgi:hypothetical protein